MASHPVDPEQRGAAGVPVRFVDTPDLEELPLVGAYTAPPTRRAPPPPAPDGFTASGGVQPGGDGAQRLRMPPWLKKRLPDGDAIGRMRELLDRLQLHTVCEEAGCPNVGECWGQGTATFMILGDICTRSCGFCKVLTGRPLPIDPLEPERVAHAAWRLNLRHVVVTSVDRDDQPDGGAGQFAKTIRAIARKLPETTIEVLTPDFKGSTEALQLVLEAGPDVFAHNVETVPRLQRTVRPQANFERSVQVVAKAKELDPEVFTKSGIMVGLGERPAEVVETMEALREAGCDFLTIGQYLRPSKDHLPVVEYVHPEQFARWKEQALALGFRYVAAGPFVRSSFDAAAALAAVGSRRRRSRAALAE